MIATIKLDLQNNKIQIDNMLSSINFQKIVSGNLLLL